MKDAQPTPYPADRSHDVTREFNLKWLKAFENEHGRKPRVLGIGNLANNGFKNALALRAMAIECDVMCNDYYHAMACPEWESAEFLVPGLDMLAPDWSHVDLQGYERPDWFVQGFYGTCIEYLIAKNENTENRDALWQRLASESRVGGRNIEFTRIPDLLDAFSAQLVTQRIAAMVDRLGLPCVLNANELYWTYLSLFVTKRRLDRLLSHYDAVIGYGTNGLLALISSTVPYIAYEHGTIRELPFDGTFAGAICALVYKAANNVLITNCDNVVSAQRLALPEFRFVPHAILESWRYKKRDTKLRTALLAGGEYDFIVFSASRQHWSDAENVSWEKGNDILIRGFAEFVIKQRPRARLVLVEWGETVAASKALIRRCGIERHVTWVEPMSVPKLCAYVSASDVFADQFLIGAWGALMPIGLMLGVPTMIYLNEEVHRWCFPEMPPILNARTDQDVFRLLSSVKTPAQASKIRQASIRWYDKYHSMNVVADRLVDAVRSAIESAKARRDKTLELEPPIYWLGKELESFRENLGGLKEQLNGFSERIAERIAVIEQGAAVAGARITTVEQAAAVAGAKIAVVEHAATVAEAKIGIVEQDAAVAGARITTIEQGAAVADTRIAVVEQDAAVTGARIAAVEQDAANAGARIATVEQDAANAGARIATVEQVAAVAGTKIATLEQGAAIAGARITKIESDFTTTDMKVAQLERQSQAHTAQFSELKWVFHLGGVLKNIYSRILKFKRLWR